MAFFSPRFLVGLLPLLLAAACGDRPTLSSAPPLVSTGGTAGSGTGGAGGRGGASGSGGTLNVGATGGTNMGGEGGAPEEAVCGNDSLEAGELCDDGNTEDDDGCSADCRESDPDYFCVEGEGCVRVVTCGNGVIEGDEVCDDGNERNDDGC